MSEALCHSIDREREMAVDEQNNIGTGRRLLAAMHFDG